MKLSKLKHPARKAPHKMLVSEMAEALLLDYKIQRRKSLPTLEGRLNLHVLPAFGKLAAVEVTTEEVECYIAERQEEGAANATINRETAALKRMYKLAVNRRQITLSEVPYIPHLRENNVRKGFVADKQYDALARETSAIGLWLRTMFELGASCGMRKGELLSLRVRQFNREENAIVLDAGTTKNNEARILPLGQRPELLALVQECIAQKAPEEFVFTRKGKRVSDFRRAWKKATKAAGCEGLLFHDLRRTGARNLRRAGVNEKEAMLITGHKTRSVFDRYNIVDRADIEQAMGKLETFHRNRRKQDLFQSGDLFGPPPAEPKAKKPN